MGRDEQFELRADYKLSFPTKIKQIGNVRKGGD